MQDFTAYYGITATGGEVPVAIEAADLGEAVKAAQVWRVRWDAQRTANREPTDTLTAEPVRIVNDTLRVAGELAAREAARATITILEPAPGDPYYTEGGA